MRSFLMEDFSAIKLTTFVLVVAQDVASWIKQITSSEYELVSLEVGNVGLEDEPATDVALL